MSSQPSQEGQTNRKKLRAVAAAIRILETVVVGTIVEYDIDRNSAELLCSAMGDLWAILEINGYTIDIETNRIRRMKP
jgi:hypothetical protein